MPESNADPNIVRAIRQQADKGRFVWITQQAQSDLLANNLKQQDVADTIVDWIDSGGRVKLTELHSIPAREGQVAFEMKPKINDEVFYIKVCFDDPDDPALGLGLLSAHPPH